MSDDPSLTADNDRPSPGALWMQAQRETDDREAARLRYRELMIKHGHLIPKGSPGYRDTSLPCGWPHRRSGS